jgi:ectoine hydroxylase-related dioxygenase (phytanoyl-CoA dioxygenase family)
LLERPTDDQVAAFRRDGFLIVEEGLLTEAEIEVLRQRFAQVFDGEYETGVRPDEVNWVAGRDREDVTRQICNAWRADNVIAAQVLSERTGRLAAQLMGYRGVRLLQDNCLWKPPGTKSLGMHQDGSYADYLVPPEMVTCWIALDDTHADAGTIEYARGSHRWPRAPARRSQFHAPADWLAPVHDAAPDGEEVDLVPIVVPAGGCAFHHSLTFHGSGSEPGHGRAPRPRLASGARRDPVPSDERRPDLFALPAARRPVARRVVLPDRLGQGRGAERVAPRAAAGRGRVRRVSGRVVQNTGQMCSLGGESA